MLTNQTGAFDTFGEILLEEHIHNQNGQNCDQTACLHPDDLFSGADICVVEQLLGKQGAQIFSISAMVWFLVKKVELT